MEHDAHAKSVAALVSEVTRRFRTREPAERFVAALHTAIDAAFERVADKRADDWDAAAKRESKPEHPDETAEQSKPAAKKASRKAASA